MAGLAGLSMVLPGRVVYHEYELRWPTLAEVIGTPTTSQQECEEIEEEREEEV
jgi:hypothetical protein